MDTKADFDAAYSFRVERYFGGHPNTRAEVRVNYHRWSMAPILNTMWVKLAPTLNIASTEKVLIVGAGFGWGIEAFINETGAETVGIDISTYINTEKDNTEEVELRAAISAVGLDPDVGRGLELMGHIFDGNPRKDASVIVLDENMQTNQSRQAIKAALSNNWPSVCILENIIEETTLDAEIIQVNNAVNLFAGSQRVIWVTNRQSGRTLQQLQTLTGSEVISTSGSVYLVP